MEAGSISTTSQIVTIEPSTSHTHTVIFLHGRGSNAHDFRNEFFLESENKNGLRLHQIFPSIRWVLPTAPVRHSTRVQEEMSEWFDMDNCQDTRTTTETERDSLAFSIKLVWTVIEEQAKSVPRQSIYLGGISQGCATAVLAMLLMDIRIAGFIGVAGWLPYSDRLKEIADANSDQARKRCLGNLRSFMRLDVANRLCEDGSSIDNCIADAEVKQNIDVLLCHGNDDSVVEIEHGETVRNRLRELGFDVEWQEDDNCGHWIKEPEQIDAIVAFLRRRLAIRQ